MYLLVVCNPLLVLFWFDVLDEALNLEQELT